MRRRLCIENTVSQYFYRVRKICNTQDTYLLVVEGEKYFQALQMAVRKPTKEGKRQPEKVAKGGIRALVWSAAAQASVDIYILRRLRFLYSNKMSTSTFTLSKQGGVCSTPLKSTVNQVCYSVIEEAVNKSELMYP